MHADGKRNRSKQNPEILTYGKVNSLNQKQSYRLPIGRQMCLMLNRARMYFLQLQCNYPERNQGNPLQVSVDFGLIYQIENWPMYLLHKPNDSRTGLG